MVEFQGARRPGAGVLDLRCYAITRMMKTSDLKAVSTNPRPHVLGLFLNAQIWHIAEGRHMVLTASDVPVVSPSGVITA